MGHQKCSKSQLHSSCGITLLSLCQSKLIEESKKMVDDTGGRLEKALEELEGLIVSILQFKLLHTQFRCHRMEQKRRAV